MTRPSAAELRLISTRERGRIRQLVDVDGLVEKDRGVAGSLNFKQTDHWRVPSGVSYVLENRAISKRAFADLFAKQSILPVDA